MTDQDEFLNSVMKIRTILPPHELLDRLHELEQEANWPDTDNQGFITLFASSLPELDVFDRDMQNKAKNWHMKLNPMKGQQRAALTTILPLGI